jgi:hypothetical protein
MGKITGLQFDPKTAPKAVNAPKAAKKPTTKKKG